MAEQIPQSGAENELNELIARAYEELRRVARARIAHLRAGATLMPTDLVNEVLLRLLGSERPQRFQDTGHLVRIASVAMHGVLVDHARRHGAAKRGGQGKRVDLDDDLPIAAPAQDMLALDDALKRLRKVGEDHFDLVMLRMYAGLSLDDIALQRGVSRRTLERQWSYIRAFLKRELDEPLTTIGASSPEG
jgi:RNA polymerase sigma factor (TIGR02999 family)